MKFPVTVKGEPEPTDPKLEPTRAEVNAKPEGLAQRIERTRRYFRLQKKAPPVLYARGLESKPEDFA